MDSLSWLPLASLFTFKFFNALGITPIPYMMLGEFFASEAKEISTTVVVLFNNTCGFLVTKFQVNLEDAIGTAGLYYFYAGFALAAVAFCSLVLPESRGRNAKEMKRMFSREEDYFREHGQGDGDNVSKASSDSSDVLKF